MDSDIGIFGGTFDPPHIGHVAAAQRCRSALGLSKVLLVVANDPWQKSPDRLVTPASERLEMVAAAVDGLSGIEVCDLEVRRGGPSYTIDTVTELRDSQGVVNPWVIVGSDLATTLNTWEEAERLSDMVRVAVLSRPGSPLVLPSGWRSVAVASDELDVSSSMIRDLVRSGSPVDEFCSPDVVRHIVENSLYI